ncbi:hypothetical protein FACS1894169_10890 [Bacteroidia bacterium]|nr:hypothetical protein FACS1894169_10890 [Bacteroidia bacterium]
MEITELRKKYYALNKSFRKKLIFHLGSDAGFFSEYNNMILAILYCLVNKIQFVLYSEDANFGYKKGWSDYFLPFCGETNSNFHRKYNFRDFDFLRQRLSRKDKLKIRVYKMLNGVDFLTQDLWLQIRDRNHENEIYNIPELGIINRSLRDACKNLIIMTWKYEAKTDSTIKNKINSLNLPTEYIGFHIRRGDKHVEQNLIGISEYLNKAEAISNTRNAFILTDDYKVITETKKLYPAWNIFTLCKESETGYEHAQFKKKDKSIIKDAHLNLFASIDILSRSKYFVGTFGSNPGMFLGMRMNAQNSISIDITWQIW